jgi:hypothetical protein
MESREQMLHALKECTVALNGVIMKGESGWEY